MSFRSLLVLCLWLTVLAVAALFVRASVQLSRHLPKRLPLMLAIPVDVSLEDRGGFEEEARRAGAEIEFVSRDKGLDILHERLGRDIPPLDSAVLGGIEGNPLPNVYILRAENIGNYDTLRQLAQTRVPSARVHFPDAALRRLAPVAAAGRAVSGLFLAALSILFCVSWSDHVGRRMRPATPTPAGFLEASRRIFSQALLSLILCAVGFAGLFTLAVAAAERRPDWPIRPAARMGEDILRLAAIDGACAGAFFVGLAVLLSVVACLVSRPRLEP
ncbi:hypothetical protein HY522_08295 [bacterium]|nr:hypothetical protein [bacterium]